MIYRKAFMKHDAERYNQFIRKALTGEAAVHSATLYPYDIIEQQCSVRSCSALA